MSWNNMYLYMRAHVEAFAWEKWGSEALLDKEFEKREHEKTAQKEKKYAEKMAGMLDIYFGSWIHF